VSRLTDFGIAYAEARLTSTRAGKLKGKMPYMAPEQLRGKQVDRRVDVYAAGCVLWEMLAGERMFSADNEAALACLVLDGAKRTPSSVNASVPAALEDACMQALLPRDARFQNARAFADALEHAADDARIPIARTRDVAALTDGLRPSLAPEETASTTLPPQIALLAEAATTHTQTVDVGDSDLPAAVRPVIVSSVSSSIPSVEMEGTSASLVAPVERTSSAAPGRLAVATLLAAIVGVTTWFALRETPAEATSSAASAAKLEAASVSVPPKPAPKTNVAKAPESATPPAPKAPPRLATPRPLPPAPSTPAASPKPSPSAKAAPASPAPASSVLHPDGL
jgi:eukaryotic-like serine/threonine-protein kinase